jgi:hypothetical protein
MLLPTNLHAVIYEVAFGKLKNITISTLPSFPPGVWINYANELHRVMSLYP